MLIATCELGTIETGNLELDGVLALSEAILRHQKVLLPSAPLVAVEHKGLQLMEGFALGIEKELSLHRPL